VVRAEIVHFYSSGTVIADHVSSAHDHRAVYRNIGLVIWVFPAIVDGFPDRARTLTVQGDFVLGDGDDLISQAGKSDRGRTGRGVHGFLNGGNGLIAIHRGERGRRGRRHREMILQSQDL
jgi:hypothetical protein